MSFLSFFKYVLFVYNFVVMVFGAATLGLSTYFYVDSLQYIEPSARAWPIYSTFFITLIGIGLFTFIIGFFGCCGACKESSCMLCMYFTIVVALCGLVGTMIFFPDKFELKPEKIKPSLQADIKEILQKSYSRYNTTNFANVAIDTLQEHFQCCGSNNYTDWHHSLQNNSTRLDVGIGGGPAYTVSNSLQRSSSGIQSQQQTYLTQTQQQSYASSIVVATFRVPVSCCSNRTPDSYNQCKSIIARYDSNPEQQTPRIPNINQDGCVEKIQNYLLNNWMILNILGGLAIGLQGLSIIFSFCLCCALNRAMSDEDEDDEEK